MTVSNQPSSSPLSCDRGLLLKLEKFFQVRGSEQYIHCFQILLAVQTMLRQIPRKRSFREDSWVLQSHHYVPFFGIETPHH
jgi:hypothetical protein